MARGPFGRTASHAAWVAGVIAGTLATGLPSLGLAQVDTLFRNFLQGVAPPAGQPPSGYPPPPSYYPAPPGAYPYLPPPSYPRPLRPEPPPAANRASVAETQRMLDELGYDAGPASGTWGERSARALRAFQRDHDLPTDGAITPASQATVKGAWYGRERAPAASAAAVPPVPRPDDAPSFNCARAGTPSEVAIRRDPDLAGLDRELAQVYAAAGDAPAASSTQQRAWMKRRDACGADAACLRHAIADWITAL